MEVLSALAIIVTLWGPVKYLFRQTRQKLSQHWTREPKASDFLLTLPLDDAEPSPDEEHYRLIYHHYPHLAQSRPFIIR